MRPRTSRCPRAGPAARTIPRSCRRSGRAWCAAAWRWRSRGATSSGCAARSGARWTCGSTDGMPGSARDELAQPANWLDLGSLELDAGTHRVELVRSGGEPGARQRRRPAHARLARAAAARATGRPAVGAATRVAQPLRAQAGLGERARPRLMRRLVAGDRRVWLVGAAVLAAVRADDARLPAEGRRSATRARTASACAAW